MDAQAEAGGRSAMVVAIPGSRSRSAATARYTNEDERWCAVLGRDGNADGHFYYGVLSTGVYCRPSCGARRPRHENVRFFENCRTAEKAGFRACRRCRPDREAAGERKIALVTAACRFIESAEEPPSLREVAEAVGLSPHHFHRLFKGVTGVTPKAYGAGLRQRRVAEGLGEAETVTGAIFEAGYGASSRFYESAPSFLGMAPRHFRGGGDGVCLRYAVRDCWLDKILVAATEKGVCAIRLGDSEDELVDGLRRTFPAAEIRPEDEEFRVWIDAALALVEGRGLPEAGLPLDVRGTAFQRRVWAALTEIPRGETLSYKALAERIGAPAAVRAVARACAQNPVAVAVPCHRVVGSDGSLTGYRWGIERKRRLLAREREAAGGHSAA